MILLTKEAYSTYCLTMAQYCPQLGQLFAIAGHKMKRREKIFGRSTIAIRNMPKIQDIEENVDSVLTVMREDTISFVEDFRYYGD